MTNLQENGFPVVQSRFSSVYWPPLIHLAICLVSMLGYLVPSLQFLGILGSLLTIADFPLSIVTMMLAYSQHGELAAVFEVVVGTLWWYFLSWMVQFLAAKVRGK
jgi:hypothetical protein